MAKWHYNIETQEFHCDNLYFIREGTSGPIKIGRGDAANRLKTMQTGNSSDLHILAEIPNGGYTEVFWHRAFHNWRIRGEWFEPTAALCSAIKWAAEDTHWADEVPAPDGVCQYHYSELMMDAVEVFEDLIFSGLSGSEAASKAMFEMSMEIPGLSGCPEGGCNPDEMHERRQQALDRMAEVYANPPTGAKLENMITRLTPEGTE